MRQQRFGVSLVGDGGSGDCAIAPGADLAIARDPAGKLPDVNGRFVLALATPVDPSRPFRFAVATTPYREQGGA